MANEIQLTIAKQINAKELQFAGFKVMTEDEDTVSVMKGKKYVKVQYNKAKDTYTFIKGKIKGFTSTEEPLSNVYFDQLQTLIQEHFPNFEYVMDSFKIVGVNC